LTQFFSFFTLIRANPRLIKKDKISAFSVAKKSAFLVIFLLTLFGNTLKYPYVCQQANINRQQAAEIAENRQACPRMS
jgi:hypothetical protein